jgi:hypothetical protein
LLMDSAFLITSCGQDEAGDVYVVCADGQILTVSGGFAR